MTSLYLALGAILVTAVVILTGVALTLEYVLGPWLDRRNDLRRMIGR